MTIDEKSLAERSVISRISTPLIVILPSVGSKNLTARDAIRDLPLPLGPITASVLPGVSSKETSCNNSLSPFLKETFSNFIVPLWSVVEISPSLIFDFRSNIALTFLHPALAPESSTRSHPISIIGQESSLVYWRTIERSPKLIEPFITSIPPTRMARGTMATAMAD